MKKFMKRLLIIIVVISLLSVAGLYIYSLDYYRADFNEDLINDPEIALIETKQYIAQYPTRQVVKEGIIFYPGGKVEHRAYLPILRELSRNGYITVVVDMPLNLAVFNQKAADDVIIDFPGIDSWYIGGHSLGGAMASGYLAKTDYEFSGLILLGSYPIEDHEQDVLLIYGENDEILDLERIDQGLGPFVIEGGNHAYFGNYGLQKKDGVATISREEQQDLTIGYILEFIRGDD